jgi:hypothetical protein
MQYGDLPAVREAIADPDKMRRLADRYQSQLTTLPSTRRQYERLGERASSTHTTLEQNVVGKRSDDPYKDLNDEPASF